MEESYVDPTGASVLFSASSADQRPDRFALHDAHQIAFASQVIDAQGNFVIAT